MNETPARPVLAGGKRRQLTMLFCDLVGSTRLAAGLDPEDWRELVTADREACDQVAARFDGRVAQHPGDGVLVHSGWPRAHENDAERAVRPGLGIVGSVDGLNSRLRNDGRLLLEELRP